MRVPLTGGIVLDQPIFIIHGRDHAFCVAQASEQTGVPVFLFSARGAALSLGPEVFLTIIKTAYRHFPDAQIEGVLDCADDAGVALGALRRGVTHISVNAPDPSQTKIIDIARQLGATVQKYPTNAVDLAYLTEPMKTVLRHLMEYKEK